MKSQIRIKKVRIKSAAASGSYVALYGEKSNNSVKFIKSRMLTYWVYYLHTVVYLLK